MKKKSTPRLDFDKFVELMQGPMLTCPTLRDLRLKQRGIAIDLAHLTVLLRTKRPCRTMYEEMAISPRNKPTAAKHLRIAVEEYIAISDKITKILETRKEK
ncbi:hypothetical protein CCP2SC5_740022 [Azospirillaceae bacterium]